MIEYRNKNMKFKPFNILNKKKKENESPDNNKALDREGIAKIFQNGDKLSALLKEVKEEENKKNSIEGKNTSEN